jgi:fructuronate reductase
MGIDDSGTKLDLSPDPNLPHDLNILYGLPFGKQIDLRLILSNEKLFGINLYNAGLGDKIENLFTQLSAGTNAVAETIS